MKKYFFLLFIIVSLFLSCKKEKSEPCTPTNYTGMLPLHVGNQWIYKTTIYVPNGAGTDTILTYDTLLITGDTIIDCDTKYVLKTNYNLIGISLIGKLFTMSNSNDGFNLPHIGSYSYPYPVQPGVQTIVSTSEKCTQYYYMSCDTFTFNNTLLNQSLFCHTYSMDSVYTQCTMGEFRSVTILESYYCYGIGLIFQKNYGGRNAASMTQYPQLLHSTMELMSYTLY